MEGMDGSSPTKNFLILSINNNETGPNYLLITTFCISVAQEKPHLHLKNLKNKI